MAADEITQLGEELMRACDGAIGEPPSAAGRGIVVCAGGATMLTNAYVLVRTLRDILGCKLPIEIWHMGSAEMPALLARLFEALGCRIVDAVAVRDRFPAAIHDGWQLKSYALLHSGFEDVILLDADQVPLIDPETVFDWRQFREAGAVFWPDVVEISEQNPVWARVGLEPRAMRSWETGQVAVNRRRHWLSLWLTFEINQRAEEFYELVYGDKDTFLIAWLMTAAEHAIVPHAPFTDQRYLLQRDFDGNPAFQHRTNCKWSLHYNTEHPPGLQYQEVCEGFLDDLRKVWNGNIFVAPSRPADAMQAERELVAQRIVTLSVAGEEPVQLELLDGHQIGEGRSFHRSNWYVDAAEDRLGLVICDPGKPTFILDRQADGTWRGESLIVAGRQAVLELAPVVAQPQAGETPGLVDQLLDAARRGLPGGMIDRESLLGALRLFARIEPAALERASVLANGMRKSDPEAASILDGIVEQLRHDAKPEGERPRDKSAGHFTKPDLYRRI